MSSATETASATATPEIAATYVPGGQRKAPDPPVFNGYEEFGPGGQ